MASNIRLNILGDESHLRRAFANATRDAKRFAAQTDSTFAKSANKSAGAYNTAFSKQGRSAFVGGLAGGASVLAATQIAAQLKKTVVAAAEAQNVLGQTKVALEDTGASWLRYGSQIEEAVGRQSKLGFDDEALLKTFSLFQRSTSDVTRSLQMNALAADLARGRYIDLESAALLVLKASMGQAGALRRVGIDARQGATGVELITMLTEKYGGAAAKAGGEATASYENLKVSLENVQETIGAGALPVLTDFANVLSKAADGANELAAALKRVGGVELPGGFDVGDVAKNYVAGPIAAPFLFGADLLRGDKKQKPGPVAAAAAAFRKDVPGLPTAQKSLEDRLRQAGFVPSTGKRSPTTTLSNRVRGSLLDAQRTSGTGDDLGVLAKMKKFLETALGQTGLKPGQTLNLKQELAGVLGDIKGIQDEAAQKIRDAVEKQAQAVREAADKQKAAAEKQAQAVKDAAAKQAAAIEKAIANRKASREGALLDAERTPGKKDDLAVLARSKAFLTAALKGKGLKPEARLDLKQELGGVIDNIKSIQQDAADDLKESAANLKESAAKLKAAAEDKLDLFKSTRQNSRDLTDARANLALQNQIGGPEGIKLATRELEDAKLERQRLALQGGTYQFSGGTRSSSPQAVAGTAAAGSVVININGTQLNEKQLTNAVLTALNKRGKKNSSQSRGRQAGGNPALT